MFMDIYLVEKKKKVKKNKVSDSLRPHGEAHQASPSMEFSRQDYWSGLPFTSPGILSEENYIYIYIYIKSKSHKLRIVVSSGGQGRVETWG